MKWTQNEIYNSINEWNEHRMKFATLSMNEMNTEYNFLFPMMYQNIMHRKENNRLKTSLKILK